MSLLSRAFGVHPHRPHAERVQRDLVIPAGAGMPLLLANRFYPADVDRPSLVLLRIPYRGAGPDPATASRRGYQVLYVSLRGTGGTGGSGGEFAPTPTARCRGCVRSRGSAACWPPEAPTI
jgi:hypothetical protein